jgi:hypothetical protein
VSLAIHPETVLAVLLTDGRWHEVEVGSFDIDAYEFVFTGEDTPCAGGGEGFDFTPAHGGPRVCGPLTSILAVRCRQVAS